MVHDTVNNPCEGSAIQCAICATLLRIYAHDMRGSAAAAAVCVFGT